MKNIISMVGSVLLLIGGVASATTSASEKNKINADVKSLKDAKSSVTLNCGTIDCTTSKVDLKK